MISSDWVMMLISMLWVCSLLIVCFSSAPENVADHFATNHDGISSVDETFQISDQYSYISSSNQSNSDACPNLPIVNKINSDDTSFSLQSKINSDDTTFSLYSVSKTNSGDTSFSQRSTCGSSQTSWNYPLTHLPPRNIPEDFMVEGNQTFSEETVLSFENNIPEDFMVQENQTFF